MSRLRCFILLVVPLVLAVFPLSGFAADHHAGSANDRASLAKTGQAIRDAFARGDIDAILAYHHPEVIKALGYHHYLVGREALKADLLASLGANRLEFKENRQESVLFQGRTAVEESVFTIQVAPKDGGKPFLFKGRSMVVYVRYSKSPTGWASIREIIQPESR
jgi:hypothetical protein